MTAVDAIRQFWASGCVDAVLFGDPLATETELAAVAENAAGGAGDAGIACKGRFAAGIWFGGIVDRRCTRTVWMPQV